MSTNTIISDRRRLIAEAFLIFVAVLVCDIAIFADWLHILYPDADEFSLIVGSGRSPIQWFLQGSSDLFRPYPEYFLPNTNYIRPVGNALYRLFLPWTETGFKLQLIIINYGVHACTAAVVYFCSTNFLNNSKKFLST